LPAARPARLGWQHAFAYTLRIVRQQKEQAMSEAGNKGDATATNDAEARATQLQWNDQRMATTFANVVNIQSNREQVDLFFGTNQTWNGASEKTLTIELTNRIILSPFAAKRLSMALAGVMREYEERYGKLALEG
jgi:hypothetical protein